MASRVLPWAIVAGATIATISVAVFFRPQLAAGDTGARAPKPEEIVYHRKTALAPVVARDREGRVSREEAVAAADRYMRAFRTDQDPRHLGRAQAVLAPWWNDPKPPTDVLLLRGTLLQTSHDFSRALEDLRQVVEREPDNAQAWIVRATVETVIADYESARQSCAHVTLPLVNAVCIANVDAVTGHAREAISRIKAQLPTAHPTQLGWALSCLAEAEVQAGEFALARQHFQATLEREPDDVYTRGAYLDVLLAEHEDDKAMAVSETSKTVDAIALRRAIAATRLAHKDAPAIAKELRDRFDASHLRGDSLHEREEARFRLDVDHDAPRAAALAKHDVTVQREPADLRILAQASCAAKDAAGRATARDFVKQTGLEDPYVRRALEACP